MLDFTARAKGRMAAIATVTMSNFSRPMTVRISKLEIAANCAGSTKNPAHAELFDLRGRRLHGIAERRGVVPANGPARKIGPIDLRGATMARPENMKLFVPDSVTDVKCPECGEISPATEWTEAYSPCELCGDHSAIRCPKCGEVFEHVWGSKKFKDQHQGGLHG